MARDPLSSARFRLLMRRAGLRLGGVVDVAALMFCAVALGLVVTGPVAAEEGNATTPLQMTEDELQAEVARLSDELSRLEEEVNRWDWSLAEAREELDARQEEMGAILRAVSRYRRGAVLQALLNPARIEQVDLRRRYLRCLLEWQAGQVEQFRAWVEAFREMVCKVGEVEGRVEALQERLLAQKEDVLRRKLAAELAMPEGEQADEAGELAPPHDGGAQTETLPAGEHSLPFAKRKGHLPWPVDAVAVWYYNHDKLGALDAAAGEPHNRGIEVRAVERDAIFPVAEGQVLFAGPLRGYGRLVIVDHGENYYSLYGYIRELFVKVGQQAGMRDALGTVGRGGIRREPMLYFEIRRYGQPEDPLAWLEQTTAAGTAASLTVPAGHAR